MELTIEDRIVNLQELQEQEQFTTIFCMICQEVAMPEARKPVWCNSCGTAVFCESCIKQWRKRQDSCPQCRQIRPSTLPVTCNPKINEVFETTLIACKFGKCSQIHTLTTLEVHEEIYCNQKPCPLCKAQIEPKLSLQAHQALYCPMKQVNCPFCDKTFPSRKHLIEQHQCHKIFAEETYFITDERIDRRYPV